VAASLALKIDTSEFASAAQRLAETPDLVRKALTGALSDTVDAVHSRQTMEMKQSFNNPTPYVLRGLKKMYPGGTPGKQSNRARYGMGVLQAGTGFEYFPIGKSPEDIVAPHVFGGKRKQKRSERRLTGIGYAASPFTVMGNEYPRNGSGDIPGARYTQMLDQLGVLSEMAKQQMPKSKTKGRRGVSYFAMVRRGGKKGDPAIAIGERTGGQMRIMLVFARSVGYQKRYDFFGVGRKQVEYSLPVNFSRIFRRYMSRM
jgi:hypothetical protein